MPAKEAFVQGTDGLVPCFLFGEVQVEGKTYCMISIGVGGYYKTVYTKYQLVSPSLIQREIPDQVEIVKDEDTNITTTSDKTDSTGQDQPKSL